MQISDILKVELAPRAIERLERSHRARAIYALFSKITVCILSNLTHLNIQATRLTGEIAGRKQRLALQLPRSGYTLCACRMVKCAHDACVLERHRARPSHTAADEQKAGRNAAAESNEEPDAEGKPGATASSTGGETNAKQVHLRATAQQIANPCREGNRSGAAHALTTNTGD